MRSLDSAILLLGLALAGGASGCGPSASQLRENTLSTLNTEADRWEGGPDFKTDVSDAYGNAVVSSISKGVLNYELEVRSHGPDALPKNSDDVVVRRRKPHGESTVNNELERGSESIGRGGIRGAIQG